MWTPCLDERENLCEGRSHTFQRERPTFFRPAPSVSRSAGKREEVGGGVFRYVVLDQWSIKLCYRHQPCPAISESVGSSDELSGSRCLRLVVRVDFNTCLSFCSAVSYQVGWNTGSARRLLCAMKYERKAVAVAMRRPTSAEIYCQYVSDVASMPAWLRMPDARVNVTAIMATERQREKPRAIF